MTIAVGIDLIEEAYSDDTVTFPALWAAGATVDGEPAGQVTFTVNPRAERVTFASDMFVEPQYRRQGVASAILALIEETYPTYEIEPNGFTDDGYAFWQSRYRL